VVSIKVSFPPESHFFTTNVACFHDVKRGVVRPRVRGLSHGEPIRKRTGVDFKALSRDPFAQLPELLAWPAPGL
jgi:hypothetical protein